MDIHIFLLCYNESDLIPHTIKHYKKYLPSCKITIYDNKSTDDSVDIAKNLGCDIISWDSNNMINDYKYTEIKNNCWKSVEKGWIIMADMDEFLCVTEDELKKEMELGTTILNVEGRNMIGDCKTINLTDIDLQEIKKYVIFHPESKKLCFLREKINEMNYNLGAHNCNPQGNVVYSLKTYINKHMKMLGIEYLININKLRYERAHLMRSCGLAVHYTLDVNELTQYYTDCYNNSKID